MITQADQRAVHRFISVYSKTDERCIKQFAIPDVTQKALEELFGAQPNDPHFYNSYQITPEQQSLLVSYLPEPIDIHQFDYFLETTQL